MGNAGRMGLLMEEGEVCDASRTLRSSTTHLKEKNNNLDMTPPVLPCLLKESIINLTLSLALPISEAQPPPSCRGKMWCKLLNLEWSDVFNT